jgi:NAD(P)-dependent dehydrogenase (short-subunit alcohol dehydrogenase family)
MSFKSTHNIETDFTKKIHSKPYKTISVSRPELSQAGKTVLVTGGATGIGFALTRSFIEAGAARAIVVGRRQNVLESASDELQRYASEVASGRTATEIVTKRCDQANPEDVKSLWTFFKSHGIEVDVLVLNAASFAPVKPILDIDPEELWSIYQTNVYGPILIMNHFTKQPNEKRKVLIPLDEKLRRVPC